MRFGFFLELPPYLLINILHIFSLNCVDYLVVIYFLVINCRKNECPVCRTHCPDQLSLRDDPNYDALIALLCPDIDKFEKEEEEEEEEEEYFVEEDFVARSYILALPANPRLYNEEPVVDDDNDVADELVVEEDNSDDDSSNST
ncbi:putative aminoacyltransferase, E1 ubiquitin-activating enzyme [Medicago truncatula]|uniref:Putative aminoacyltransferase, E1 ubiquitin-activating enzyme n=1 Tax=Medicago truncatula TaxID=3880 RepID=A0A396IA80_MEDTR|nr:putative aminoacyltransferase, E1 ubiquitin-activating enzyme [Medicago truncatula]